MIILIDNYDSFSYNLYQLIGSVNQDIKVYKNDLISVNEIIDMKPSHIILSPGPGRPKDAGIIEEVCKKITNIPILGICLGHQAICEAYGLEIINAKHICHGKKDNIRIINNDNLFKGLGNSIEAARYHSLIGKGSSNCLEVLALNSDNEIMAIKHKDYPIYGLQFHPESIMTKDGLTIIKNFLGGK